MDPLISAVPLAKPAKWALSMLMKRATGDIRARKAADSREVRRALKIAINRSIDLAVKATYPERTQQKRALRQLKRTKTKHRPVLDGTMLEDLDLSVRYWVESSNIEFARFDPERPIQSLEFQICKALLWEIQVEAERRNHHLYPLWNAFCVRNPDAAPNEPSDASARIMDSNSSILRVAPVSETHFHLHFSHPVQYATTIAPFLDQIRKDYAPLVMNSDLLEWNDLWDVPCRDSLIIRKAVLEAIANILAEQRLSHPGIISIYGPAGTGKTVTAELYANNSQDRFDGRLYFSFGPNSVTSRRLTGIQVLQQILPRVSGISSQKASMLDAERLISIWTSLTSNRKLLMIWDDVEDLSQIASLITRNTESESIVISREALSFQDSGIRARYYSMPDGFSMNEAISLFENTTGTTFSEHQVREIFGEAPLVPLAVSLIAGDMVNRSRSGKEVAIIMKNTIASSMHLNSLLDLSFISLSKEAQLIYCAIGSHPGFTYSSPSLAAMTNLPQSDIELISRQLLALHLCSEIIPPEKVHSSGFLRLRLHGQARRHADQMARHRAATFSVSWDHEKATRNLIEHYCTQIASIKASDADWFNVESENMLETACSGTTPWHRKLAMNYGRVAIKMGDTGRGAEALEFAVSLFESEDIGRSVHRALGWSEGGEE